MGAFKQIVYSDFSGGLNDTSAAIAISDNQLPVTENAVYSAEVKALQTRNGCVKVNAQSFNSNVTDGFSWLVGGILKRCIVMDNKLYELNTEDGSTTFKIALRNNAKYIYPFVYYNKLYFGDGSELYEWGGHDFTTSSPKGICKKGQIVMDTSGEHGKAGHFYKALFSGSESITFSTENYTKATRWEDVTDIEHFSSSEVREMIPFDSSKKEVVLISVLSAADASATVSIVLDGVTTTFAITSGDSVPTIVNKLKALSISGWESVVAGNAVRFTATQAGRRANGYIDPSTSGVKFNIATEVEGKANDCSLEHIKKCTIFCVHQGSFRVFAAGNPEDNALYYSEIGQPTYFNDKINKVYPAINGYGKVTALGNLSDALIVSYDAGWYSWTGTTPLQDAAWKPLNIPYGCVAPKTLCLTPNSFTFLARSGIYEVSVGILSQEAVMLQGNKIIKKLTENVVENVIRKIKNKKNCEAAFFENVYYLSYNTDGVNNDYVLAYEWDTKSFTVFTGWRVNRFIVDIDNLYFTTKNYVLKAFEGYSDIDVDTGEKKAIKLHIKTKEYHLGTPLMNKNLQHIGFIFQQHDKLESKVYITIRLGYETFNITLDTLAESLYYGREWARRWGYRESIVRMAEVVKQSNVFQIELKNEEIDDPITLIGIGFIYDDIGIIAPEILKDKELHK